MVPTHKKSGCLRALTGIIMDIIEIGEAVRGREHKYKTA